MSSHEIRNRPKRLLSVLLKNFLDVKCPNCVSSLLKMSPASGDERGLDLEEEPEDGPKGPSSSNVRHEGPETTAYNMEDLKVMDFNSADEVRRVAKAVLQAGNAPDLHFNDSDAVEQAEDGIGNQKDVPMNRSPSQQAVKKSSKTESKISSFRGQKSKLKPSGQSKAMRQRKKKSKFVNSCKRTVTGNMSKFYSGKLSNLMTSFGRDGGRKKRLESSSDQCISHIWS